MESMEEKMAAVEAAAAKKAGTGAVKGHLDAEELKQMKLADLKAVAEDMGLDASKCKTKADYAAMIAAEEVEVDLEGDGTVQPEEVEGLTHEDILTVTTDDQDQERDEGRVEEITGVALVTYNGMVNLRDMTGTVDGQAMQGQTFPVHGKLERDGVTWYKITDRHDQNHLISGKVVRFMEK